MQAASLSLSLTGKVALITGGSRGIGRAIALTFARAGADVAVSSRKLPDLEKVAAEIRAEGRRALAWPAHNRKPEELRTLVAKVTAEFGRIDILVNNAATSPLMGPITEMSEEVYDQIMNTNLKGYFILSQLVARHMMQQGGGVIINIASAGGLKPVRGMGLYCLSKAGVIMLTRILALELGDYGIRVNAVAPGVVQTRFSETLWKNEALMGEYMKYVPIKRIAQPEEVAQAALYLASEASSYVTGHVLVLDGGSTV